MCLIPKICQSHRDEFQRNGFLIKDELDTKWDTINSIRPSANTHQDCLEARISLHDEKN